MIGEGFGMPSSGALLIRSNILRAYYASNYINNSSLNIAKRIGSAVFDALLS